MSNWIVYILQLNNGNYYTGITNNLDKRLKTHAAGKGSKCVRANLPFKLVYTESAQNRSEASKREYEIKQKSVYEKQAMIDGRSLTEGENNE